jgi:hypothetical protein
VGLHEPYKEDALIGENLLIDIKIVGDLWNSAPASHNVLEKKLSNPNGDLTIPDCVTGQPTSISDEIVKIIDGRMSGNHVQCQAQWGDN